MIAADAPSELILVADITAVVKTPSQANEKLSKVSLCLKLMNVGVNSASISWQCWRGFAKCAVCPVCANFEGEVEVEVDDDVSILKPDNRNCKN